MTGHQPTTLKCFSGFTFCGRCGLIYLSNKATRKAIQKGCYDKKEEDKYDENGKLK